MDIQNRINEIYDEIVAIRRDFHKNPELSQHEFRTQKKIEEYLNLWGIENYRCAETGVVGIIRGKHDGTTVGLRGDIDALPINEKNNTIYCSINPGVMHACGHDAHTSILLGVGKIMKEIVDNDENFCGNVKLFFQPAEETIGGGKRMVEEGCMKNPDVDYMLGLHVMPYIDAGKVELKYGKLNASTDTIKIKINGKSAHGAYPDKGTDAIVIAGNVITALQTIVSRNISPLTSVVISLGKISGGVKDNVISDEVEMSGTLRALDDDTRNFVKKRIEDMVTNTAVAYGGTANVDFSEGYQALINNDEVVDVIKENVEKILGEENIVFKEFPSLGAEDFSYFSDVAKGAFFHLGCGDSKNGIDSPIHTEHFDIDEKCLKIGIQLQVENIMTLMNKN
jgi:amidohydrolase